MSRTQAAGRAADRSTGRAADRAGRRRESKETRREQLMDATLATVARKGLAATTLADVADAAGLSRGIVNFHFESKDRLLLETLTRLAADYDANWREELSTAGPGPAERLHALVTADFSERVCAPEKVAAWFAFQAEAAVRADYRDLCWARDDAYVEAVRTQCAVLEPDAPCPGDPAAAATTIYATQEGLWLRLMLGNGEMTRGDALGIMLELLARLYPAHFAQSAGT